MTTADLFPVPESRDDLALARAEYAAARDEYEQIENEGLDDTGEASRLALERMALARNAVTAIEQRRYEAARKAATGRGSRIESGLRAHEDL